MSTASRACCTLLTLACLAVSAPAADFQPPDPPQTTAPLGAGIQRAMTLLATSTPTHHNRVRILYYGQSITAQQWTGQVTAWLKAQYPNADIEAENRAIGGFTAPSLIRTAEHDLYSFYPDLLIFHVYGGDTSGELEKIVQRVRQRTTADILMRTPHFRWDTSVPRDGSPDDPKHKGAIDADEAQAVFIRAMAPKYGLELADTRLEWQRYLTKYDLRAKDMLADGIHLNPLGNQLMAALVIPHLRYQADQPTDTWRNRVRDLPATRAADGSLELRFVGNRVDAVTAPEKTDVRPGSATLLIDGKSPAEFQELLTTTRPSISYKMWWPALNVAGHSAPRVPEKWTLKITRVDAEAKNFWFSVTGSVTGPDGEGERGKRFVSNSGRLIVEPGDWWMEATQRYANNAVVPEGFEVTWEVKPNYLTTYQGTVSTDPTRDTTTTLFQGLAPGEHTLRLTPNGPLNIAAFRVYNPPLAAPLAQPLAP
ncbi:MAG: SGNH/GDSL hydrolase family protein [Armatimonadetes bacterium]|nr:SGNH/GDSL hydrolase family protein [Armatimonadota bacterium]